MKKYEYNVQAEEVINYTIRTKRGNFESVVWIGHSEEEMLKMYESLRRGYDKIEKENKELGIEFSPFEMSVEKRIQLFIESE